MTDPGTTPPKVCACGKHQDYRQPPPAEPAERFIDLATGDEVTIEEDFGDLARVRYPSGATARVDKEMRLRPLPAEPAEELDRIEWVDKRRLAQAIADRDEAEGARNDWQAKAEILTGQRDKLVEALRQIRDSRSAYPRKLREIASAALSRRRTIPMDESMTETRAGSRRCDGPNCGAEVVWAETLEGKRQPFEPNPEGNRVLLGRGLERLPLALPLTQIEDDSGIGGFLHTRLREEAAYMPHHATCPDVERLR
jgi:hypothetical protein